MVAHGTQLRGTSRTSSAFRSVGETEIFWYVMPQCMGIFTYIFAGYQIFAAFWLVILTGISLAILLMEEILLANYLNNTL